MTRRRSTIDYFIRTRPDEYCDVAPPGQVLSDRAFMRQQAERIVRSPKLRHAERAIIEKVWLSQAAPSLKVVS